MYPQVSISSSQRLDRCQIFQAGHAGSVWAEEGRALFGPRTRAEGEYLLVNASRALSCKSVG